MCVQAFPGIAPDRLVRSGPGWHRWMRRNAGTTMVPVAGRPAARGSWHMPPRESLQKKSHAPTGQTEGTANPKLAGRTCTSPTWVLLGLPLQRGAGCTRQGRKTFLTWDPPVQGNFELWTPNSVHGCTLARPTWRRMKKGTGVHCARAVHVQVVCTLKNSHALTGQTGDTTDPKLAGHTYTVPT